jgi:hypothetical protein
VAFFLLAAIIWRLINKYIPELLQAPSPQDPSLMGPVPGSRVNITLGDEAIPRNAALPPDETADNSVGNIEEVMNRGPPPAGSSQDGDSREAEPGFPAQEISAAPIASSLSPGSPAQSPPQGMDQGSRSGYTESGSGVSRASPSIQTPAGGFSGLGDTSGDVESLPDLDALAGSFLSPAAGEEDPGSAGLGSSPRPAGEARSRKGKNMGEDFNPKELASAIQTILKRD